MQNAKLKSFILFANSTRVSSLSPHAAAANYQFVFFPEKMKMFELLVVTITMCLPSCAVPNKGILKQSISEALGTQALSSRPPRM